MRLLLVKYGPVTCKRAGRHDEVRQTLITFFISKRTGPRERLRIRVKIHKGVISTPKTQVACGNPTWHAEQITEDTLVEFMFFVFACMPVGHRK